MASRLRDGETTVVDRVEHLLLVILIVNIVSGYLTRLYLRDIEKQVNEVRGWLERIAYHQPPRRD